MLEKYVLGGVFILTPDYLLHISEGAEQIASELHEDILHRIIERIMFRLGRGENYLLTATDKWNIEVLQDAGYLLEDIQREIAKRTKLQQAEVAEAMEDAGVRALSYDDTIYKAAGLSPVPLTQSPYLMRLMQRNYEATMGEWKNFTRTTAEATQRVFIDTCSKIYHLTVSGSISYTQAVREAVNEIASDGVVVKYPSGHTDTIETATLRCVRTGVSQATANIQLERMNEMGVDLVLVSSHLGARPSHAEWQGKIYHVDTETLDIYKYIDKDDRKAKPPTPKTMHPKYPDFVQSTRYGFVDGLCGANCRHNFSPYFEGMENPFKNYDSKENQEAYEIQQKQRELERRIRDTKRNVMARKTAVDNCKDEKLRHALDMDYQKKALLLAKQKRAYNDFCEQNNLKRLSDRMAVARFDRQQAAAARGAARRYENAKGK